MSEYKIIGADDLVMPLSCDKLVTVEESYKTDQKSRNLKHALFTLRREELDNEELVRSKLSEALRKIQSGLVEETYSVDPENAELVEESRAAIETHLRAHLSNVAEFVDKGKQEYLAAQQSGIMPVSTEALEQFRADLTANRALFPESFERLLGHFGHGVIVTANSKTQFLKFKLPEAFGDPTPSQQYFSVAPADIHNPSFRIEKDMFHVGQLAMLMDYVAKDDKDIFQQANVDGAKFRYEFEKKKAQLLKGPSSKILPEGIRRHGTVAKFSDGLREMRSTEGGVFGYIHLLLTEPSDPKDQATIRSHFDRAITVHDKILELVGKKAAALDVAAEPSKQIAAEPPEDGGVHPVSSPPSHYEKLRVRETAKHDYKDVEQETLAHARSLAEEWENQHHCNQLNCRLLSTASGYGIQLSFGRDGTLVKQAALPLPGMLTDNAVDLYLLVERVLHDEHPNLPPSLGRLQDADAAGAPPPAITTFRIGNNDLLPHPIVQLAPDVVPVERIPNHRVEIAVAPGVTTQGYVTSDTHNGAVLVMRNNYDTPEGKICASVNIPLFVRFDETERVEQRKAYALNYIKEQLLLDAAITKKAFTDHLRTAFGDDGIYEPPPTHVDGYDVRQPLRFPSEGAQQETYLSPARLVSKRVDGGNMYYAEFRVYAREGGEAHDPQWHIVCDRSIPLVTSNIALASSRAGWVMDKVKNMFENTLMQGCANPPLPPSHRWDIGPYADGKRHLKGDRHYDADQRRQHRAEGKETMNQPYLTRDKADAFVDYFANIYREDFAVRTTDLSHTENGTQFTLELIRATRENFAVHDNDIAQEFHRQVTNPYYRTTEQGGADPVLPGELVHLDSKSKRIEDRIPVRTTFDLHLPDTSPHEREAAINQFVHKIDADLKMRVSAKYKTIVMASDIDLISGSPELHTASVVNEYAGVLKDNLKASAESLPVTLSEAMPEELAERFVRRGGGSRFWKFGSANYIPVEMENALESATPSWTSRIGLGERGRNLH